MKGFSFGVAVLICFTLSVKGGSISDKPLRLPLPGNTWVRGTEKVLHNNGISGWKNVETIFETYIRVSQVGTIQMKLQASAVSYSTICITVNGVTKRLKITPSQPKLYSVGSFKISDTGYVKIELRGMGKSGEYYPDINYYELAGSAVTGVTNYVPNNDGNFFYWGRRGPSVHLNYPMESSFKAEWFYNELTVPTGEDKVGSYFMANGFSVGYFGIQVNSETERRVLFSVWSPFNTDDPKAIPDSLRIKLIKKGEGVHTGEFGNEGAGGQSYLRYNWVAGQTYKFLLRAQPDATNRTTFTAYFFAPEKNKWLLIASFKRPSTNTSLTRLHSFLENFIPEKGDQERQALYSNQWVRNYEGKWMPLLKAKFTADNTARKGFRMDYAGGVTNDRFMLKNCGFFQNCTPINTEFFRNAAGVEPVIDIE